VELVKLPVVVVKFQVKVLQCKNKRSIIIIWGAGPQSALRPRFIYVKPP